MTKIPTRDEFAELLSGMTDLSDYDDAIAAYDSLIAERDDLQERYDKWDQDLTDACDDIDAQVERIAELEAEVDLFHECYQRARQIWRTQHPERAEHFDPDGAVAIAAMVADHDIWEKASVSKLAARIAELEAWRGAASEKLGDACETTMELEAACRAALDWYGPDGDHIHEPQRSQLLRALGLPGNYVGVDPLERIAELEEMVRAAAQRIEELTLAARIKELEENDHV